MIIRFYKPRPELQHFVSRIMLNRLQLDTTHPRSTIPFPPQPEHCLISVLIIKSSVVIMLITELGKCLIASWWARNFQELI